MHMGATEAYAKCRKAQTKMTPTQAAISPPTRNTWAGVAMVRAANRFIFSGSKA